MIDSNAKLRSIQMPFCNYRSVEELENAVNEYITYWNQKRIKLSLGGLSPVEYRTEYQKAG